MDAATKRGIVVAVQSVLAPPIRALVVRGLVPGYGVIETTGRRSGRPRRTVVGVHEDDDALWVVAEHGHDADYVRNLRVHPRVRLCLRGRWRAGVARVVEDDDPAQRLEAFGPLHAAMVRRLGTHLLSIRIVLATA